MNDKEKLIQFVKNFTPEQAQKLLNHIEMMQLIANMSEKELLYTDRFLDKMFGYRKAD